MNPENKTVIVTGASSGIGEATARRFYAAGSRVVLAARSADRLHALALMLEEGSTADTDRILVLPTDVSEKDAAQRLVDQTWQRFGSVDILINNAGRGLFAPVADIEEADLHDLFDVNFFGPLYLIQAALPVMQAQGSGIIMNVSSIVGQVSMPMSGGYCATKFALGALSDSLRMELRDSGIKVVTVYPGSTDTAFSTNVLGNARPREAPRGFAVKADRVAQTILHGVQHESRDVHVTWIDRLFVTVGRTMPHLTDWLLPRVW